MRYFVASERSPTRTPQEWPRVRDILWKLAGKLPPDAERALTAWWVQDAEKDLAIQIVRAAWTLLSMRPLKLYPPAL